MSLSLPFLNQNPAGSSALIAPNSAWSLLQSQAAAAVHAADFWSSGEKALTIAEVRQLQHFAAQSPVGEYKIA